MEELILGGGIKQQELKQSFSDRRGTNPCSTGQSEEADEFLSIGACKSILVETQNEIMNLQMCIYMSPLSMLIRYMYFVMLNSKTSFNFRY